MEPTHLTPPPSPPVSQDGHKVCLAAVMVTHVPLAAGAGQGSLGMVANIGLSHDRGWKD